MDFSWTYKGEDPVKIRSFLISNGVSHRMFSKLRHHELGDIRVNGKQVFTSDYLEDGDTITITMPPEEENEKLLPDFTPMDIVHEDDNWLIVNKPFGVTTVPGSADRLHTLVNQVKGHLIKTDAENMVPHVVTRLDRDTSGLVLLAKHKFAHAVLDDQLQKHEIKKIYTAIASGVVPDEHGIIDAPIGRVEGDFIRREVRDDGKRSITEYWVTQRFDDMTVLRIQLHTGRTHQIRVHFSNEGYPLVGDDLYGGPILPDLSRQALNAGEIEFFDPFENKTQNFKVDLPKDIQQIIDNHEN